jgi:phosphotransferase system IIB component
MCPPAPPPSNFDGNQVLQHAFDETEGRLRVDAVVNATVSNITIEDSDGDELEVNNDGSINVQVTGATEVEIDAADGDNIAISDGTNTAVVNADGSLNVKLGPGEAKSVYDEVSAVASSVLTTILSFTCPIGVTCVVQTVKVSGTNTATFSVSVNSTIVDKSRTYFGGNLNDIFDFRTNVGGSVTLSAGDILEVEVIHNRPGVGDFNSKLDYIEV